MEMLFSQEEVWEMERRHIARQSRQEGMVNGILLALRGLIGTTGIRVDGAMVALKIAEADRPRYKTLLEDQK